MPLDSQRLEVMLTLAEELPTPDSGLHRAMVKDLKSQEQEKYDKLAATMRLLHQDPPLSPFSNAIEHLLRYVTDGDKAPSLRVVSGAVAMCWQTSNRFMEQTTAIDKLTKRLEKKHRLKQGA